MRRLSLLLAVAIATPSLAMDGAPDTQPSPSTGTANEIQTAPLPSPETESPPAPENATDTPSAGGDTTREADQNVLIADALLAQRLSGTALEILHSRTPTTGWWKQAAALLEAAQKLDPNQPRYPKMLAEAALHAGNRDEAISALKAYRLLAPADQGAQVQLIDLYASQIQGSEKRVAYLTGVADNPTVPAEVRSYAAMQASVLHHERSEEKDALAKIEQALRLNPLNVEALDAKYAATATTATPPERVALLLRLLTANPAQPDRAAQLANELADSGIIRASLDWYGLAIGLWNKEGQAPTHEFAVSYAAELLLAGRLENADTLAGQMLELNPNDVDATFIQLLIKKMGPKDQYAPALEKAGAMLRGRVVATRDQKPTTQPAPPLAGALPDLSQDIAQAAKPDQADHKRALTATLADLAWYQIYFKNDQAEAAKSIGLLRKLAGDDSVTVARLDGWSLLMQGRTEEASVKLSAVADRDPLSAMGSARILLGVNETRTKGMTASRKVLAEAPAGLVGAIVWDGLKDLGVKRVAANSSELIMDQLDKFPRQWLQIIDDPSSFYTLRGEPLRGSFSYGEPMLCEVFLTNTSNFDITIGPRGVVKPDLWFDAQMRGLMQKDMPGIAYDRMTQAMVLHPRQSISQIVRIDQGGLRQLISSNPAPAMQIYVSAMTNPTTTQNGISPGVAGIHSQFNKIFSRRAFPIGDAAARAQLVSSLADGGPSDKFNAMEIISTVLLNFRNAPAAQDDSATGQQQVLGHLSVVLNQARLDPMSSVAGWASYLYTSLLSDTERARAVDRMLADDDWTARVLGVVVSSALQDKQTDALQKLVDNDAEPIVRQLASAVLETNKEPHPSTQPTTAPAPAQ